jgi:hypothetical protein
METEKDDWLIQSRIILMSALVKENSPGGAALDSKPQAAMVSMTPNWGVAAELAAAHVSRRIRTSDFAPAKRVWIPDQSKDEQFGPWWLTHSLGLTRVIHPSVASIIYYEKIPGVVTNVYKVQSLPHKVPV